LEPTKTLKAEPLSPNDPHEYRTSSDAMGSWRRTAAKEKDIIGWVEKRGN